MTANTSILFPLYAVNRTHLEALHSEYGLFQHTSRAKLDLPNGTCTDDVARALLVDLAHGPQVGWAAVGESIAHLFGYLVAAYNPETGRFRNFRTTKGEWLELQGSEDTHARAGFALAALGTCAACAKPDSRGSDLPAPDLPASDLRTIRTQALALWQQTLLPLTNFTSLRAVAMVSLGYDLVLAGAEDGPEAGAGVTRARPKLETQLEQLGGWLFTHCVAARQDSAWRWPEATLTYESALVVRALLTAGSRLARPELTSLGLEIFDWLLSHEITDGLFVPIGNQGWWPRGGSRAFFDQQPIEAYDLTLTAICLSADWLYALSRGSRSGLRLVFRL